MVEEVPMFARSISAALTLGVTLAAIAAASGCGGSDEESGGASGSSGSGGTGGSGGGGTSGSGGSGGSGVSGTGGSAGGGQSIDCKGTSCSSAFGGTPCCAGANGDKCGFDVSQFVDGGGCIETNQAGNPDPSCDQTIEFDAGQREGGTPDGGFRLRGCCRPNGKCGVILGPIGCGDPSGFLDAGAPRSCTYVPPDQ